MSAPVWQPSRSTCEQAQITHYRTWLKNALGLQFDDYDALWRWSTQEIEAFWGSLFEYLDIRSAAPYTEVLASHEMPGARWFPGVTLNYAAEVFRHATTARPAIVYASETEPLAELSWEELERQVGALAATLRKTGIGPGDRVVAYLPNIPETVIAFLATVSVGAVWSVCAPDLGKDAILDRFGQIEPSLLFTIDGYHYGGKSFDRSSVLAALVAGLPSLNAVIEVPRLNSDPAGGIGATHIGHVPLNAWATSVSGTQPLEPVAVPFEHPLWVLYSSGTTGAPKAIVHGQGGVVLEHMKYMRLHCDLGPNDRFHWYSSTAWMMWNFQIAGLLTGTTICLYDGNPGWPDLETLWKFADEAGVTFFGAGAAFYDSNRNRGIVPRDIAKLDSLRAVGSTGSPLLPEAYRWIYAAVKEDVYLTSIAGGTDFASAFIGGVPTLPVYAGEMQCRCLGAAVAAFNDAGEEIIDEVGELVCTEPLPSMPIYFWNDENKQRYRDSYFNTWPNVWRHGDWVRITPRGGVIIYGRSDATINRHGIRMGTSELYRAVEEMPEILDSLVVDLEYLGKDSYLPLFVVLAEGTQLNDALNEKIRSNIRSALSPRHVPDDIFAIEDVPRTFSGKKLEIPIRRLLLGQPAGKVINPDIMANPDSIRYFIDFANTLNSRSATKQPSG